MPRTVSFFLDFVSPYTWLAIRQARRFAAENDLQWDLRPVVYAVLLDGHGLVGPVETEAKRTYTFQDVARCARRLGLPLHGPPAHPFRSLEALRTLQLFRQDPLALALAERIADAAWVEGSDLTRAAVLEGAVRAAGLDATDLSARIAAPEVKAGLREATERALSAGVFGVPTFVADGAIFWGHDRLPHLADHLAGLLPQVLPEAEALRRRPRGAERTGAPRQGRR